MVRRRARQPRSGRWGGCRCRGCGAGSWRLSGNAKRHEGADRHKRSDDPKLQYLRCSTVHSLPAGRQQSIVRFTQFHSYPTAANRRVPATGLPSTPPRARVRAGHQLGTISETLFRFPAQVAVPPCSCHEWSTPFMSVGETFTHPKDAYSFGPDQHQFSYVPGHDWVALGDSSVWIINSERHVEAGLPGWQYAPQTPSRSMLPMCQARPETWAPPF